MTGSGILKRISTLFGPKPVNTLDFDSNAASQRQLAPSNARTDPPPPKRPRLETSRGPLTEQNLQSATEDIEEFGRQETGPRRRRDSTSSLTLSHSPIMSNPHTYSSFGFASYHHRSNRRRRRSRSRNDDIQDDDVDEIARNPKPVASNPRKALLKYQNDPADIEILNGSSHSKGKKRLGRPDSEDDELTFEPLRNASTGVSPVFARKAKVVIPQKDVAGYEVLGAVCQKNFRYIAESDSSSTTVRRCFLRPASASGPRELRAFTKDGEDAQLPWLKITGKVRNLGYSSDSPYIKITQSTDTSANIGSLMVIKFASPDSASRVKEWVQRNMRSIGIVIEESSKLVSIYDKTNEEISRAIQASPAQISQRPASRQQSQISPPKTHFPDPAISPRSRSNITPPPRVPFRSQMQVSGEKTQPTEAVGPSLVQRPAQSSVQLPARRPTRERGDRALRSTQDAPKPEIRSRRTESVAIDVDLDTPPRWTEEHPGWEREWKTRLVYNRTTVERDDIPRLDEGQFLNDNLISFGLRYLFDELATRDPELNKRVYLHNSFFYTKLKGSRGTINYDSVKNWTAKVDLLSYDYIVVPVNENFHWWVAIICNPGRLDPDTSSAEAADPNNNGTKPVEVSNEAHSPDVKMTGMDEEDAVQQTGDAGTHETRAISNDNATDQRLIRSDVVDLVTDDKDVSADQPSSAKTKQRRRKLKLKDPRIITLDSLAQGHPQAVTALKKYLIAEFEHKRNKVITDVPQPFGMKAVNIPFQNNFCDCGIYLLAYIQEFVQNPDKFIQEILDRDQMEFPLDASTMRESWRDTIFIKQNITANNISLAVKSSREASIANKTPSRSAGPSNRPSRESSETAEARKVSKSAGSFPATARTTSRPPADVYEVSDSEPETSPQQIMAPPKPNRSSPPKPTASPGSRLPDQENDEVMLLRPTFVEADSIRPSIESMDLDVAPNSHIKKSDEPRFLPKLSPPPPIIREVNSKLFYANKGSASELTKQKRSKSKSSATAAASPPPNGTQRTGASQAYHTTSHFVVSDVMPVDEVEVVRDGDPPNEPIEIDSD